MINKMFGTFLLWEWRLYRGGKNYDNEIKVTSNITAVVHCLS